MAAEATKAQKFFSKWKETKYFENWTVGTVIDSFGSFHIKGIFMQIKPTGLERRKGLSLIPIIVAQNYRKTGSEWVCVPVWVGVRVCMSTCGRES